jgi:hypothetical protein
VCQCTYLSRVNVLIRTRQSQAFSPDRVMRVIRVNSANIRSSDTRVHLRELETFQKLEADGVIRVILLELPY